MGAYPGVGACPGHYGIIHRFVFYSQNITSGRWRNQLLAANSSRSLATIFDALSAWLNRSGAGQVYYTDTCQGTCTYKHASIQVHSRPALVYI